MPEQFELFNQIKKNEPPEEAQEDLPKKVVRKPGSKYYDPGFGTYAEQDDYVQKALGGTSANINKRAKEAQVKSRQILEKRGIIDKEEKTENNQ